jgi:hypothetical protein
VAVKIATPTRSRTRTPPARESRTPRLGVSDSIGIHDRMPVVPGPGLAARAGAMHRLTTACVSQRRGGRGDIMAAAGPGIMMAAPGHRVTQRPTDRLGSLTCWVGQIAAPEERAAAATILLRRLARCVRCLHDLLELGGVPDEVAVLNEVGDAFGGSFGSLRYFSGCRPSGTAGARALLRYQVSGMPAPAVGLRYQVSGMPSGRRTLRYQVLRYGAQELSGMPETQVT